MRRGGAYNRPPNVPGGGGDNKPGQWFLIGRLLNGILDSNPIRVHEIKFITIFVLNLMILIFFYNIFPTYLALVKKLVAPLTKVNR